MKTILVIDAQGGGVGKQIISLLKKESADLHVIAVGSNSVATNAMLKAGADEAATGENSVITVARKADVIVGPVGIVIADSMLGEITPAMAAAVGASNARRVLMPFSNCDSSIVGIEHTGTSALIRQAVEQTLRIVNETVL